MIQRIQTRGARKRRGVQSRLLSKITRRGGERRNFNPWSRMLRRSSSPPTTRAAICMLVILHGSVWPPHSATLAASGNISKTRNWERGHGGGNRGRISRSAPGQFPFELLVRDSMCSREHATAAPTNTRIREDSVVNRLSEMRNSNYCRRYRRFRSRIETVRIRVRRVWILWWKFENCR